MKKEKWLKSKNLKCVVLAAGRGSRLLTLTERNPKPMVNVTEKPILAHVVNYWSQYSDDFIFVVNYKKEKIVDYVRKLRNIKYQFVTQKELKGIADALLSVEKLVGDRFIVVLGDCICDGYFNFHPEMEQGVGVWETKNKKDTRNSYSIKLTGGIVGEVKEKPKRVYNNFCGQGFYFFDRRIFDYIRQTPPSKLRGEIELTNVIQNMIQDKQKIYPVLFKGYYININTEEDLRNARKITSNHAKKN